MSMGNSKNRTRGVTDPEFQAELEDQIARMREMLKLMAPATGAMALGAIRRAFPDAPLAERVRALKDHR